MQVAEGFSLRFLGGLYSAEAVLGEARMADIWRQQNVEMPSIPVFMRQLCDR
ncbi:hypothetical protein AAGV37_15390 [Pseudomonas protegens]|jgi:hypothetical protein|uniref:hypothetical protein n=2 Tax=Pseudomonas TaxID=286 RepID=UPI000360C5FD